MRAQLGDVRAVDRPPRAAGVGGIDVRKAEPVSSGLWLGLDEEEPSDGYGDRPSRPRRRRPPTSHAAFDSFGNPAFAGPDPRSPDASWWLFSSVRGALRRGAPGGSVTASTPFRCRVVGCADPPSFSVKNGASTRLVSNPSQPRFANPGPDQAAVPGCAICGLHAVGCQVAPDRCLGVRRRVPHRAHLALDLGSHRAGNSDRKLLEQVEPGAVDHVVVADARIPFVACVVLDAYATVPTDRGDVRHAPGDEPALIVVGDRLQRRRVEHAGDRNGDEVAACLRVQRIPTDLVGVREHAILQEALATAHRQAGGVDRQLGVGSECPQERHAAERALAAADDRDVGALIDRNARQLDAPGSRSERSAARHRGRAGTDDARPGP